MKKQIFLVILYIIISACTDHSKNVISKYKNGKVKEEIIFNEGFDTIYLYSENQVILGKCRIISNKKEGNEILYYPNGKLLSLTFYENGNKNGEYIKYDEYGRIKELKNFQNDSLFGISSYFDDLGHKYKEIIYIDNIPVILRQYLINNSKTKIQLKAGIFITNKKLQEYGHITVGIDTNFVYKKESFYYELEFNEDTLKLGTKKEVILRFVNSDPWNVEFHKGALNANLKFSKDSTSYKIRGNELRFEFIPNNTGINYLMGKLVVTATDDSIFKGMVGDRREIIVFEEYYVE